MVKEIKIKKKNLVNSNFSVLSILFIYWRLVNIYILPFNT